MNNVNEENTANIVKQSYSALQVGARIITLTLQAVN